MNGDTPELVMAALAEGIRDLERFMDPDLIPGSGSNLVYALPGAQTGERIARVQGGIVSLSGQVHMAGPVGFGANDPVARIVLTAMRFDPAIRSAALLRYSPGIIGITRDLLLEACSFDRSREPPGTGAMDWGVAFCCRSGVPDIIYDSGAAGKEPLVRVLGQDPREVAGIIGRISTRYRSVQGKDSRNGRVD